MISDIFYTALYTIRPFAYPGVIYQLANQWEVNAIKWLTVSKMSNISFFSWNLYPAILNKKTSHHKLIAGPWCTGGKDWENR